MTTGRRNVQGDEGLPTDADREPSHPDATEIDWLDKEVATLRAAFAAEKSRADALAPRPVAVQPGPETPHAPEPREGGLLKAAAFDSCNRARQASEAENAALRRERDALRAALLDVSTDNAQDALEDPIGHAEREAGGFYRIGKGAMNAVRRALASETGG